MKVVIVGGGAAGMYLAVMLDGEKHEIHLYEQSKKLGRKYLVAGKGGFNLSKDEIGINMVQKYHPLSFFKEAITRYDAANKRGFLSRIGIETYVGSSGKIFPVPPTKPYEVLAALKQRLLDNNVQIHYEKKFSGFQSDTLLFESEIVTYDKAVFALGGASWSKTGSDGNWTSAFADIGVNVLEFEPSNCRLLTKWPTIVKQELAGLPLKNVRAFTETQSSLGEVMLAEDGIEGGAIYAVGRSVRHALNTQGQAAVYLDLKPDFEVAKIERILNQRTKSIKETLLKHIKLSPSKVKLLVALTTKDEYGSAPILAKAIKFLPIPILACAPLDEAISTAGGIDLKEVTDTYALKSYRDIHCIGEMLSWDTITGGYLLQGCYSMAAMLAAKFNKMN